MGGAHASCSCTNSISACPYCSRFIARDLLQAGVHGPAGQGDITIEPADHLGRRGLRITLATDCLATMMVEAQPVIEFLVETYALVPSGCELDHIDFDAEIAALLV